MESIDIFKEVIGSRICPLVVKYKPYMDRFETYPFRHAFDRNFENMFANALFDSIVFYAYEKDEIEKEYEKNHLNDLRKASRVAYSRVPKTEKENDGLMGELTLDCFIKLFFPNIELLYSRAKYMERFPHKEENPIQRGHEIKGYDGFVFSIENNKKFFWAGQVKTGGWDYCFSSIKGDINKSIINYYFSDAIAIMCDIMRATSSTSEALTKIIDDINEIIYDCNGEREKQMRSIVNYFKASDISIRIPCLLMPDEANYNDETMILNAIKAKVKSAFSEFALVNDENIDVEVLVLVFPMRNLQNVRKLFLEIRQS